MEASKKKAVMIGVIVGCLVLAGVITYLTQRDKTDGPESLKPGVMYWLKCTAEGCGHEWQMDRRDYFEYLEEHQDPNKMAAPGVVCPKCGGETGYRAEKCEKCGHIFMRGTAPHDFADRCPECGHSKTEEERKEARKKE
jgi:ribosomal protein L40E